MRMKTNHKNGNLLFANATPASVSLVLSKATPITIIKALKRVIKKPGSNRKKVIPADD